MNTLLTLLLSVTTLWVVPSSATINNVPMAPDPDAWFDERSWAISANRLLDSETVSTQSGQIYIPKSMQQVAEILKSNPEAPIASVCGGHEASNAALVAAPNAIILDFSNMKKISINDNKEITLEAGVISGELVEFVRANQGALPVGTGASVGVVGYIVNGGLSGFFSRRLGLLGQRVTKFTIVLADGSILEDVTRASNPELFSSVLGAGGALGIVTEISFTMAEESSLQSASQFVATFASNDVGVPFSRQALSHLRDNVLTDEGLSMEMVYTAGNAVVITFVFYDTFSGDTADHVGSLRQKAVDANLTIVQESTWSTWFEAASALWPVVEAINGKPLALFQHSIGSMVGSPSDSTLDFVSESWIAETPLVDNTIVELRCLGGAVQDLPSIPSGNTLHPFFSSTVVMFDAQNRTTQEIEVIGNQFRAVLDKAKSVEELSVDVSGTHSQGDDAIPVDPKVIFGSSENFDMIVRTKMSVDPCNRFQFHPYSTILPVVGSDSEAACGTTSTSRRPEL